MTKSILKELAKSEKESVKFQEKEKFLTQKQKKLQKAIQTVRVQYISGVLTVLTDTCEQSKHSTSEAAAAIEKFVQDIDRYGKQISTFEENLGLEEEELDRIRNTLKGRFALALLFYA